MPMYEPMPECEPTSTGVSLLEPIIPKVRVIEISSFDSPAPTSESHLVSDSFESDPFEVTSNAASHVSSRVFGRGHAFGPRWIIT